MKHIAAIILLGCLPVTPGLAENTPPEPALIEKSRTVVQAFFGQLKGALETAMKAGGPVHAIEVCNRKAPEIAAELSATHNMHVARTSLKTRNSHNAPDAWEAEILRQFETRKAAGENPDTINYSAIVETDGKKEFRYMQAIIMPPESRLPCLKCHGENLDDKVASKLKTLYPDDKATGYKAGDVRGAFSLRQSL